MGAIFLVRMLLHDLAKSCKKLGKIMHGLILPRCLSMYLQDHSRSCRIMQDIFARGKNVNVRSPLEKRFAVSVRGNVLCKL